jgi:hypothetical protein
MSFARAHCTEHNLHQVEEALSLGVKWTECTNHQRTIAVTFNETQHTVAEMREDE